MYNLLIILTIVNKCKMCYNETSIVLTKVYFLLCLAVAVAF